MTKGDLGGVNSQGPVRPVLGAEAARALVIMAWLSVWTVGPGFLVRATHQAPAWGLALVRAFEAWSFVEWLVYGCAGLVMALGAHVGGHVFIGRILGARLVEFAIGPLALRRVAVSGRLSLRVGSSRGPFVPGAFARLGPVSRLTPQRGLLLAVADVLASVLLVAAALAVLMLTQPDSIAASLALPTLLFSYGLVVAKTVPVDWAGSGSVSALMERGLTGVAKAKGLAALFQLRGLDNVLVCPAEWPDSVVQRALEFGRGRSALGRAGIVELVVPALVAKGRISEARDALESTLQSPAPWGASRKTLADAWLWRACLAADADGARASDVATRLLRAPARVQPRWRGQRERQGSPPTLGS